MFAPGLGGLIAGAGNAAPGAMENLMKQQQFADQMAADTLIGQAFQGGMFQQAVPGAQPMPGGPQQQAQAGPPQMQGGQTPQVGQPPGMQGGPQQQMVPGAQPMQQPGAGPQMQPPRPPMPIPQGGQPQQGGAPQGQQWKPPINPAMAYRGPGGPQQSQGQPQGGQGPQGQGDQQGSPQGRQSPLGRMSFEDIVSRLQKSPMAQKNPRALGAAILKLGPLMNSEARAQAQAWMAESRMQNTMLAEQRLQQNQAQFQQRAEMSQQRIDMQRQRISLQQAHEDVYRITQEKRWQMAEQQLNQAKRAGNQRAILAAVGVLKGIVSEKIQAINAGIKDKDPEAIDIKKYQDQIIQFGRQLNALVDQEANAPAARDNFQDRFQGGQEDE